MERIKKVGKSILKRAGNKKRLRRSRSMPLNQFNLPDSNHNAVPLYSQHNTRFSKPVQDVSGPSSPRRLQRQRSTDTEDYSFRASQLLPPLPMKILERQEHERKIQYNRDLAACQLEGRSALMLNYRYMTIDHTHSTAQKPTSIQHRENLEPRRGELQWDWQFPQYRRSKRSSARFSKTLVTQWHLNASCDALSPLSSAWD
ncbi:hypothetical protein BDZ89DRAFT_1057455 [Hymenopellis radicata]|nr:hypothetical protein BDZ89DRAFT_1057455 [Hymenopellis radicata]